MFIFYDILIYCLRTITSHARLLDTCDMKTENNSLPFLTGFGVSAADGDVFSSGLSDPCGSGLSSSSFTCFQTLSAKFSHDFCSRFTLLNAGDFGVLGRGVISVDCLGVFASCADDLTGDLDCGGRLAADIVTVVVVVFSTRSALVYEEGCDSFMWPYALLLI